MTVINLTPHPIEDMPKVARRPRAGQRTDEGDDVSLTPEYERRVRGLLDENSRRRAAGEPMSLLPEPEFEELTVERVGLSPEQEIRARALESATRAIGPLRGQLSADQALVLAGAIFDLAESFAAWITDGTRL